MSLAALQSDFQAWLVTGADDAAARFPADAQAGLTVYQNNYRAALMACLEESFPRTCAWIGADAFRSVAAHHIDDCPPDSWSLDHYAAHLPPALAAALPDDPEVAELARLEWALTEAFVGRDADALDIARLPRVDWDSAVLSLVPSAQCLALTTNAPAIWSALAADETPPDAVALPAPVTVLVWRQQETACFRALDPLEADMAQRLVAGMGFADICARLVRSLGESAGIEVAGAWLGRWVADGLVVLAAPAIDRSVSAAGENAPAAAALSSAVRR